MMGKGDRGARAQRVSKFAASILRGRSSPTMGGKGKGRTWLLDRIVKAAALMSLCHVAQSPRQKGGCGSASTRRSQRQPRSKELGFPQEEMTIQAIAEISCYTDERRLSSPFSCAIVVDWSLSPDLAPLLLAVVLHVDSRRHTWPAVQACSSLSRERGARRSAEISQSEKC
ncbi:hypothetical protein BDZ90DRAFT_2841 [Jaminaea rosea]|uniref:Uncharacterized protein n=1 Tax=Jaminaea rosea TaxID=1569628 RepID=A0A316UYE3_9BASI|nr:hypothetical protein BDZ90DRAFT_2841 [Jaminaea rosea]PWN30014.1 hypothetical protein BDZ90DRAFT_2841 [Jaminaea rosea]